MPAVTLGAKFARFDVPFGKPHFARDPLDLASDELQELRMILFLKLCLLAAQRHQLFPLLIERGDAWHRDQAFLTANPSM
jgi:hypothetical protein